MSKEKEKSDKKDRLVAVFYIAINFCSKYQCFNVILLAEAGQSHPGEAEKGQSHQKRNLAKVLQSPLVYDLQGQSPSHQVEIKEKSQLLLMLRSLRMHQQRGMNKDVFKLYIKVDIH